MSTSGMSVGRDYDIVFYDRNRGDVIEFGDLQKFTVTQNKTDIESKPYNDVPRAGYVPGLYEFTFEIVRTNARLENYHIDAVNDFYAGRHVRAGFLNETVRDPNGSVNRYQYSNFVFFITDTIDVSRDSTVPIRCVGRASLKQRIA